MVDPISIVGLSLQVVQILAPIVNALRKAYHDGKTVHQSLHELHSDLDAVYELAENIHRLFSVSSFIEAIRGVQTDSKVDLEKSLLRALDGCSREAQKLLEILTKLGLQTRDNRVKQAHLQWRLDRRLNEIDRLKRNFQDHKSSVQLAFQLLTTCKQMQIAERDARHASELRAQIGELQKAIQQISQQINTRQVVPGDEEQTQLLDDMKDMQHTSVNLQRRATMRLEYLTSLVEEPETSASVAEYEPLPVISKVSTLKQISLSPAFDEFESRSLVSGPFGSPRIGTVTSANEPDTSATPLQSLSSQVQHAYSGSLVNLLPAPTTASPKSAEASSSDTMMSAGDFEDGFSALLASAASQQMGINKPFSEEVVIQIANMLTAVGRITWSERPRTYLVLRLINEVKAMDIFVFEGFKDIDFPYTESTLPICVNTAGARHNFLYQQRYVLSPKSVDLVRGGRHRHLDRSADTFFTIIENLGSGGFSVVDRVRSRLTLQEYARKRIDRSSAFAKNRKALNSFENEVHNLKRLSHHHLVEFVGSYTDKKYIGIIMQPVADLDLHNHLAKPDWTSEELATLRSFAGCLCSALAYLHNNKCRHKDLKPHNILIKGDTVLLADFGTAFDWTESQNETTMGPPEAFTKLYIAPEVALHEPRNTSSDIWSLGCVFLEMATILSGKSLQNKSSYFGSLGTSSAAYWRNHESIGHWITMLRNESDNMDAKFFRWTESMTALNPSSRPTADDLVSQISMEQDKDTRYGRSCCFEDLRSDNTSWEGSVAGDDIFETAQTVSDATTMSTGSMSTPRPLIPGHHNEKSNLSLQLSNTTVQPLALECEESQVPLQHSFTPLPAIPGSDDWRGPWSTSGAEAAETLESTTNPTQQAEVLFQAQDKHEGSLQHPTTPPITYFAPSQESALFSENMNAKELTEVEKAFFQSHQQLESHLIHLKSEEPNWQSRISTLIDNSTVDSKGFNILIVACNFSNSLLSKNVVEIVVKKNPKLVNNLTIFKNSALHYAARNGRTEIIELLIANGAQPNVQNLRGQTPLHIALREQRPKAVKMFIPHLSPDQINAADDRGRAPIHGATFSLPVHIIQLLISAGADANIRDRWGATPIQYSEANRNSDITAVLVSEISRNSPGFEMPSPISALKERLQSLKGYEMADCHCETCLMVIAVRRTGNNSTTTNLSCLCPNHLRVYIEDTLSAKSHVDFTLKDCLCTGCTAGREYNAGHQPCGTPISRDYLPYNDGLKVSPRVPAPFSEPPRLLSSTDFAGKPLPPYPGHQYYDRLIEETLASSISSLSPQELTTIALKDLADAGLKGSKSYRKDPNKALKWVIKHRKIAHLSKIVEILLDCGGDVDIISEGWGLMDIAANNGDLVLGQLLLDKKATVDILVPQNPKFKGYTTPLRVAVFADQILFARMLLRAGANVNNQSVEDKSTLLHRAVLRYDKVGWHIPLLLAHGGLTELRDADGNMPLHVAVIKENRFAAIALLESGADVEAINKASDSPLSIALGLRNAMMVSTLLLYGADVHKKCGPERCALFRAIRTCHTGYIVRLLLEEYSADEDIYRTNKDGDSCALLQALAFSSIRDASLIDTLIGYVTNIDAENPHGWTALHMAAFKGHTLMVKKLLEHGATMHMQNHDGDTPLDLAKEFSKQNEIVACLGGKKSWWRR